VEVTPARGAGFAIGAAPAEMELLVISAVACAGCPSATPDAPAAEGVWDDDGGAVIEAMGGRLVNVRCCGEGIGVEGTDALYDSIGFVMCMDSVLEG